MARIFGGVVAGISVGLLFSSFAVVKFVFNLGRIEGEGLAHLGTVVVGYVLGGATAGVVGGALAPLRRTLPGVLVLCVTSVSTFVFGIALADAGFRISQVDLVGAGVVGAGLGAVAGIIIWIDEHRSSPSNRRPGPREGDSV